MNKRLVLLVALLLVFILIALGKSNLFGPKIDDPIFIKSLLYSEEMDIDLNYIAPRGFDKSVEKIQILNAPEGIDCVVYGEEKESGWKYKVGTVNMGVNCEHWSEEKGIGNDVEINEVLVTWSDGSQTTEDVGSITVTGGKMQCNNYMSLIGHDGIWKATYTLTNDTEIIGLDCPYKDEVLNIISNITINNVPLEDISKDNPIKLKKDEMCIIQYQVNDESKSQYGNLRIRCFLMGKSSKTEEKIANFVFVKKFDDNEGVGEYLKKKS